MPRTLVRALAAFALLSLVAGCDAVNDLDNIDVTVKSQAVVEGKSAVDVLFGAFPSFDGLTAFDVSQTATFQQSKYAPSDVDSVHLKRLVLRTTDPAEQDLAFLGTVTFYIETEGLPRIELASQDTFLDGQTEVAFTVTDADLKGYLLAKEANVTSEVAGSERPPQDTTLEIEATFDVDIKLL